VRAPGRSGKDRVVEGAGALMSVRVGIAGAARNAAAALCDDDRVVAVCEQERVTRTRRSGLETGQLPHEALEAVLRIGGRTRDEIAAYAIAENAIQLPAGLTVERVDHHHAHAATSFYTSPFDEATVLICDRHGLPEITVWRGENGTLTRQDFSWSGPGFATLYSRATEALGFSAEGEEHKLEALAQVGRRCAESVPLPVAYGGDHLAVTPDFQASIANLIGANGHEGGVAHAAKIAEGLQRHLADLLLQCLRDVKRRIGGDNLCLGGGFFYNSYFNSAVAQSDLYERTFVPVNPGNAGVAVGAALAAGLERPAKADQPLSPFLGPEYEIDAIKRDLDNCKLSYDYDRNGQMIERTAAALAKGQLVGWFQGRMEWGPRALGNRSILASPIAPYVLDNLNVFLKRREPHRPYSVSVCEDDAGRFFRGPATSRFMEYDYEVIRPDILRPLLPLETTRLRVQTVPASAGLFHQLIKAAGDLTGVPILVNTSFNGFNEPIVCTPRDAVRVFYGTGLDMAVVGNFVLRK
jgi:carbamoyltransferase